LQDRKEAGNAVWMIPVKLRMLKHLIKKTMMSLRR
jgi:hypothetical protein